MPQTARAYAYRIVTALGAAAIVYGWLSATEAAVWGGVAAALFAVPAANTPTRRGRHAATRQD